MMIEIEIDGKKLQAQEGAMIIQIADEANIYIPRFCYHPKLSIAANCRMCLVEVEKAPKTLPACATPVTANMKVFTQSERALFSQRAVMEFLLINHPLDCPICDQGGECELQDLAMGYGKDISRYNQGKRSVLDKDLGPLVSSDMTRCIQCTRCVRFGAEVAGMRELGATGRGEDLEIGTYIQHTLQSELSGNIIDVCPVGALTSKPFRFRGRAWEMIQHPAVAPHDCVGSNIFIHTRGQEYTPKREVMRVVPRDNEAINETWISDRDRYSYEALHSPERISLPLIKRDEEWQEVDWQTGLSAAMEQINKIVKEDATQLGAVISPSATLEELYLLQKLMRSLGSHNIDHRYRQLDFRDQNSAPLYPQLGLALAALEKQNAILLIGSDPRREQPVANVRLRKVALQQNHVMCINPIDYEYNYTFSEKLIVGIELVNALAKVLKALLKNSTQEIPQEIQNFLAQVNPGVVEENIARKLEQGERTAIILGAYALNHPQASLIRGLAEAIATLSQSTCGVFSEGANSAGAWLVGAVPHRAPAGISIATPGLAAKAMFEKNLAGYLLFNVEPELDTAYPALAQQALQNAQTVIVFSPFCDDRIRAYADIILPIAPFAETSGTYLNAQGDWQTSEAVTLPQGEVRPAWKVLRVLANLLELKNFNYHSCEEILQEIKTLADTVSAKNISKQPMRLAIETLPSNRGQRFTEWPIYCVDNVVRRSAPLQANLGAQVPLIRINPQFAAQLNLKQDDWVKAEQNNSMVILPLMLDESIVGEQISIPAGLIETAGFGEAFGEVRLSKVERKEQ